MRSAPAVPAPVAAAPAMVTAQPAAAPAPVAPVVTQTSPPKAEVKKVAPTVARSAAAAPGTYKVVKGDNPYTIAKNVGVSSQELLKLNGIEDPTKLQIGQVLKVPGKAN